MTIIVHCLAQRPRSHGWIVRTDGQPDCLFPSESVAVEYGRTLSARIANRYGARVSLRLWPRLGTFLAEMIEPGAYPASAARWARRGATG